MIPGNAIKVAGQSGKERGRPPMEASLSAVSYTHLRAHETVLDLVCRLLLEKKKDTHTETETTFLADH